MEYYAMITPGQASDWGNVILVDSRIFDFLNRIQDIDSEDEINELRKEYKKKEWDFLKSEFQSTDKTDIEFWEELENNWNNDLCDSYYDLSRLSSTYEFNSVTKVVDFALEYNVKVIGDIT